MIPTFVITLREGVEASLIVGIIAAFLVKEGRQDALRQMWVGVGIAIVLCAAVGVGLDIVNEELPQKQQEGLETIVGLIAVATISYMIIWMTRHSRGIKSELEGEAASALARGSAMALVAMAFLAVLREGFETSVFLLAAFQNSTNTTAAGGGAVLGLRRRAGDRRRPLPRRRPHQPLEVLQDHRPDPGLRRRRAAGDRRPHRPRGGLDQQLPVGSGEPALARPPRHGHRIAAHRHARAAAGSDPGRGLRLPGLRRSDGALRALAARPGARPPAARAEQRPTAAQTPA